VFLALFKNAAALALLLLLFLLSFLAPLEASALPPELGFVSDVAGGDELRPFAFSPEPPWPVSAPELSVPVSGAVAVDSRSFSFLFSTSFSFLALAEEPNTLFRNPPWESLLPVVPASLDE
jgi:hypothetical protein